MRKALEYVPRIVEEGTSADRQLDVFRRTGDLKQVVQWVVDETRAGNTLSRV